MFGIIDAIEEWIRDLLISMITSNLTTLFDDVNTKVGTIATEVGRTPQQWNGGIFNMVRSLSENVMVPIAGIIITFVLCYDGRYSRDMKEAAAKVVIPGKNTEPLHDRRLDYHINCHPVTVNVAMRDLLVIERQQEKPAQRPKRKESVLGKLKRNQAAIAAGTSAAKENAKETPQLS